MNIRKIKGSLFFASEDKLLIQHLSPFEGHEWKGKLPGKRRGSRKKRDALKKKILSSLLELQGDNCCFCGLPFFETSLPQVEHIAPKSKSLHKEFIFTEENLALACSLCNGFSKKGTIDTVTKKKRVYKRCQFSIVHPYYNNPKRHYDFKFADNNVLISYKTRRGEITGGIFDLHGSRQSIARGGVFMREELRIPAMEELLNQILKRKYSK
jgi:hypothetical protein